jgi:hypothetical protein
VYLASSRKHADHEAWLIDSSPSFHMNPHREWFFEYEKYDGGNVRKTGPRSNKIKQMQKQKHRRHTIQERHRFTWFTQCGLRPPEKLPGPSFIIIQQMKGYNLQQNPL